MVSTSPHVSGSLEINRQEEPSMLCLLFFLVMLIMALALRIYVNLTGRRR